MKKKLSAFGSLKSQLVTWFLVIAITPLLAVSITSYFISSNSVKELVLSDLDSTAVDQSAFILNWFDYRQMDIYRLSNSSVTSNFLEVLAEEYVASGWSLKEYVNSYVWETTIIEAKQYYANQWLSYDYIYDLFLIDANGNILFTLARGPSHGSNLFTGSESETLFSKSVKTAFETGETTFSDIERYASFNNELYGFLSSPVVNSQGEKVGVLAIQLKLDRLVNKINAQNDNNTRQYIIGSDSLLRTKIENKSEILNKKVAVLAEFNNQKNKVLSERTVEGLHYQTKEYKGINGNAVLGTVVPMKLNGVDWNLVVEVEKSSVFKPVTDMFLLISGIVIITLLLVFLLALFMAKRLSLPVLSLVRAAKKVASGDLTQYVHVNADNEIGELAHVFNDMVTARKEYQKQIENSHLKVESALKELQVKSNQLELIIDSTAIGIWDWQLTTGGANSNERACEMLGYKTNDLPFEEIETWLSLVHRDDIEPALAIMQDYLHGQKEFFSSEVRMKHAAGHWIWVLNTGKTVEFTPSGKPYRMIGTLLDITQQKTNEAILTQAKEDAEAGSKAKNEFMASMSHEIRTPMNGVLGMLGLLERSQLNAEQQSNVRIATSSAESLLTLINDVLDFAKVEAGKLDVEKIDFNIIHALGEFSESIAHKAQEKGIEFILDVTQMTESFVQGDPGRLRQILNNLVSNAIKFTANGEVVVRAKLTRKGTEWLFECDVTDTGIGIPKHKQASIFESFTQVDTSTTRKYGGTGLGLSIVKKLCELMGGEISLKSEEQVGSTFHFSIMLGVSEQYVRVIPNVELHNVPILVVDDNDTNRAVLSQQLACWGANVTEADSAESALALLASETFKIALLDFQMPEMNGYQLGEAIRADEQFNSLALIMMTSVVERGNIDYFEKAGFDAYFSKPTTMSDLFDSLSLVLNRDNTSQHGILTKNVLANIRTTTATSDIVWPEKTRILLVEDNHINQLVAKGVLNEFGLSCDFSADGLEAIYTLKKSSSEAPYTIILMDCQMPEMDGYEATEAIRRGDAGERYCDIPIIAMTANAMKGDKQKCLDSGMNDYLSKPIVTNKLHEKLELWLIEKVEHKSDVTEALANEVLASETLTKEALIKETASQDNMQSEINGLDASQIGNSDEFINTAHASTISVDLNAIWNEQEMLSRLSGSQEMVDRIITLFLADKSNTFADIKCAFDEEDLETLSRLSHSLKGVSGNMAANALYQSCLTLEASANQGNVALTQVNLAQLEKSFDELVEVLTAYSEK